jgi:hypothetical protein
VVKMAPLDLSLSAQLRLRRRFGSRAYDDVTKELRLEVTPDEATPKALGDLLAQLVAVPASADA